MKYRIWFKNDAWLNIIKAEENDPRTQQLEEHLHPLDIVRYHSKLLGIPPGSYIKGDAGPSFSYGKGKIGSGEPINELETNEGIDIPDEVKTSCGKIIQFCPIYD